MKVRKFHSDPLNVCGMETVYLETVNRMDEKCQDSQLKFFSAAFCIITHISIIMNLSMLVWQHQHSNQWIVEANEHFWVLRKFCCWWRVITDPSVIVGRIGSPANTLILTLNTKNLTLSQPSLILAPTQLPQCLCLNPTIQFYCQINPIETNVIWIHARGICDNSYNSY